MAPHVGQGVVQSGGLEQRQRALLIGEPLAVRERQIQELLLLGRQASIEAPLDRSLGDVEGLVVGGEGPWRAAKHVARHLIEQDAQRETTLRASPPKRSARRIAARADRSAKRSRIS